MEKVIWYESLIRQMLEELAKDWEHPDSPVRSVVVADTENKHFQLLRMGWKDRYNYTFYCVFHLDIINDKIWIQENRTDIELSVRLLEAGVPKSDIVLGMLPPEVRKDSGFAV